MAQTKKDNKNNKKSEKSEKYTESSYTVINKTSVKFYNPNVISRKKRIISS